MRGSQNIGSLEPTARKKESIELVHTHRTLHNCSGSWHCFAKWVSINISPEQLMALGNVEKDTEGWIELINQYLQYCIEIGLSPYTQATYKVALAKVLGVSSTNFIATQPRTRANRMNNRVLHKDYHLFNKNNDYWHKIVTATGLRESELIHVTGDAMQRERDGRWYLNLDGHKHHTKGRRDR